MPLPQSLLRGPHTDIDLELVSGRWPTDISGEIFLSAPSPTAGLSSSLFGFGTVIRLSLQPGLHGAPADRWAWRARIIETPTRRLYERAPEAFVPGPLGFTSPLGSPNMANTAPLPWGDRLLATWDVGRPVEVDPLDLGFLGELGHRRDWGGTTLGRPDVLPFYFSSAHPIVDPERHCLWTVKLVFDLAAMQILPHIVRLDGDGRPAQVWPMQGASIAGSMHTITQTRDWLVCADSGNFKADPGEMMGGPRTVTIDDEVSVYLVRKDDLERTPPGQPVVAAPFRLSPTTGHYYARYDDSDGRVHVLFEHMDRMDLGFKLRADDRDAWDRPIDPSHVGMYNMAMATATMSEVVFDPATGTSEVVAVENDAWSWNHQLSAMDWSLEGITAPETHHVVYQGFKPGAISQRALAVYGDRVDRSRFPGEETPASLVTFARDGLEVVARHEFPSLEELPTSPTFVPRDPGTGGSRYAGRRPGGSNGWVACIVLADTGMRVELFDAASVGAGPVAVLRAAGGETVPLLLHSAWAPRAVTAPDVERLRFGDELEDDALDLLDDDLRAVVRDIADELAATGAGR